MNRVDESSAKAAAKKQSRMILSSSLLAYSLQCLLQALKRQSHHNIVFTVHPQKKQHLYNPFTSEKERPRSCLAYSVLSKLPSGKHINLRTLDAFHTAVGQHIGAFIAWVASMALYPAPLNAVATVFHQIIELLP